MNTLESFSEYFLKESNLLLIIAKNIQGNKSGDT